MRPRFLAFLLILAGLALSSPAAWAIGLRDVINAVELPFQNQQIKDYSADFFQESRIASLDRLQRARGRVSVRFDYRRSGQVPTVMFYWEYEEPTRQEIVSDGKTLWVYLPENNQVIQSDVEAVSQARENDPMTFLTGLGNLSRDFQIGYADPDRDAGDNYILDLRPRRKSALINRMVIVVDRDAVEAPMTDPRQPPSRRTVPPAGAPTPDDFFRQGARGNTIVFPILSTTVYDANGNSTVIEFSDVKVNRAIPAGQFRFSPPAGVEVVRPTGKEMGF